MSTDRQYNGLNGTIMLNTGPKGLGVGTTPGGPYGYKRNLRVGVEVRIERLERQDTYQTTQHEHVTRPLALAVTSFVWRPDLRDIVTGGATVEPLRDVATIGKPANGWTTGTLAVLAGIGARWHLNDMQAGCAHQTVAWETDPDYGYRRPSLDRTPVCPRTGYRYGTSWLLDVLPDETVARLLELLAPAIADKRVYVHPALVTA